MIRSTSSTQNLFNLLPNDLKILIFEHLTLLDYSHLSLVCQDFNCILQRSQNLWTKHLFRDFLDVSPKGNLLYEEDTSPEAIVLGRQAVKYTQMVASKELLIDHQYIRLRWKSFFEAFLAPQVAQTFTNEALFGLKHPSYPPPCLKKDVHFFPTNTLFQNLLTEAQFGIHGRSFFQEKKQVLVERIAEQMEISFLNREINTQDLVNLRWYHFHTEQEGLEFLTIDKEDSSSENNEEMKKKGFSRRKGSLRENSLFLNKPRSVKTPKTFKGAPHIRSRSSAKPCSINEPKRASGEQIPKAQTNEEPCVEEFYWMLQNLIENYCKITFSYLETVGDPYLLLSEYTRLWNKFVLLVIDLSQTFIPFTSLFNRLYNEQCKNLPHFPEFSTWRLMVRIWIDQVFCPLDSCLRDSFRSVFMRTRKQENFTDIPSPNSKSCDFSFRERLTLTREEAINILKLYYHAINDISHNEYTIFFWDCNSAGENTPKGQLDSLILQDTKKLYNKINLLHNTNQFKQFLSLDMELLVNVLGNAFSLEAKKTQTNFLREFLCDMVFKAIKEAETNIEFDNKYRKSIPKQNGESESYDINLRETVRFLCIEEDVPEEFFSSKENRNMVSNILAKNSQIFNSYLFYLTKEEEKIEEQISEIEDMKDHRHLRGFMLIEEQYNQFFELCENVSLSEVRRIGREGKNIKEEIENMDDMIVFL